VASRPYELNEAVIDDSTGRFGALLSKGALDIDQGDPEGRRTASPGCGWRILGGIACPDRGRRESL